MSKLIYVPLIFVSSVIVYNNFDYETVETYDKNEEIVEYVMNYEKIETVEDIKKINNTKIDYLLVIEIESINLLKAVYDKTDERNNIDKNLYLLPESTIPTTKYSNIIIGGHSGTGSKAYFKNLNKIKKGDRVNIYHSNKKLVYKIKTIYEDNKDGSIIIRRNNYKDTITLFTCNPINKDTYLVLIGELI